MPDYLNYKFEDTPGFISTFDELPLWSAPFGQLLLKHVELKPNLTVVDIGCGAGFPLLELAQRLGSTCQCFGVDCWVNACNRVKEKIANYGVSNVEIIETSAAQMPFGDSTIDLVVSSLGINNFEDPLVVFNECCRVLRQNGKLVLTTNLNGHWKEFYEIFEQTLRQLGKIELLAALKRDEEHRGTIASISGLFTDTGFKVTSHFEDSFHMRFLDGSAFLNHSFIKLGWLGSWKALVPEADHNTVFESLEKNLNIYAGINGGLALTVPMAYVEGTRE